MWPPRTLRTRVFVWINLVKRIYRWILQAVMALTFGKYRGKRLNEVPSEYLVWLAGFDNKFETVAENVMYCDCNLCASFKRNSGATTLEECEEVLRRSIDKDGVVPFCVQGPSRPWWVTYALHKDWVMNARREVKNRRICTVCLKTIVPVGHARLNGKDHPDWEGRTTHKECWKNTRMYDEF